jgi:erythromycin esterase
MLTVFRYGLGIALLASSVIAHCGDDAFVKWAAVHAITVRTLDSTSDFSDLLPIKSMIGAAQVVALGEPVHGAHEPMAFRNRLFRFLVEQMGFTAIAIESGFTESRTVDSFVGGGPGDTRTALRSGMTDGFARYDENRKLIQWMRNYNATASRSGHRKIHFYGLDLPAGGRLGGPRLAIDYALAFLSRVDPVAAESIRALSRSLPASDDDKFGALSPRALAEFDSSIAAIAKTMATDRSRLITQSSLDEYHWALHNLDVARQLANHFRLAARLPTINDLRDGGPVIAAHDYAMARNVQWIVQNEGPQGRVLVFAHDGHVMNWQENGGIFSVIREKPFMMGSDLRKVYGRDLFIIATSSATTSAGLPRPEPIKDSIDGVLAQVGLPAMVLDIRMARQSKEAAAWLSAQRPLHANISTHILIMPLTAADAFFFVEKLTPAHRLPIAWRVTNEFEH